MRSDWEKVKGDVMEVAIYAKFSQQQQLKRLLLLTGNHPLVQIKPTDGFWGSGKAGEGRNMQGVLLMKVRDRLRQEENQ